MIIHVILIYYKYNYRIKHLERIIKVIKSFYLYKFYKFFIDNEENLGLSNIFNEYSHSNFLFYIFISLIFYL